MMIHEVTELAGPYKKRKRVGRGRASGVGKTSGRGHNGAMSRAGFSRRLSFEGGQMPLFRRVSKRGFTNVQFTTVFRIANLRDIVALPQFAKGGEVTAETLEKAGLIGRDDLPVKVLGDLGDAESLSVKLDVKVARVTGSARKLIEGAGGSVTETGTRRDRVRGIDRNSGDNTPTNLTKKLKRLREGDKRDAEFKKKAEALSGGGKKDAGKKGAKGSSKKGG